MAVTTLYRPEFDCGSIVDELVAGPYRDISGEEITVNIEFTEDLDSLSFFVYPFPAFQDAPTNSVVKGVLPRDIVNDGDLDSILRGGISHEFSHIAKSHATELAERFNSLLFRYVPKLARLIRTAQERATDRNVIRRGLGEDLLAFKCFWEDPDSKYPHTSGQNRIVSGYTSQQLQHLLEA